MSYAGERRIVDADSHLMERPDFLTRHADRGVRKALPVLTGGQARLELSTRERAEGEVEGLVALGDELTKRGPKWHAALGAVDGAERSVALDLLGFEHQVVYSSLCAPLFSIRDPDVRYPAYRAHNRAMAEFCSADARLLGVAMCDLDDVDRALLGARCRARSRRARGVGAGACAGRPVAGTSRPRPVLGAPRRAGSAVRAARRQRAAPHRRRVDERRASGDRAPAGRRGAAVEGHDGRVPTRRAVPVRRRPRRAARAVPRAPGRRHRDGSRLGPGHAPPPRPHRRDLEPARAPPRRVLPPAVRAGVRAAAVHALPVRGRRTAVPGLGSGALHVLVGLPARRGRPGPARSLRALAGGPARPGPRLVPVRERRGVARAATRPSRGSTPPGGADAGRDSVSSAHSEEVRP